MDIRFQSRTKCALCGGLGQYIYRHQKDRLFGADGSWSFKRCSNSSCGLVWLDPMPVAEDISHAYATYYTHWVANVSSDKGWIKSMRDRIKQAYWADRYGYGSGRYGFVVRTAAKLMTWLPIQCKEADADVRFLQARPNGHLLDVGCGAGDWLLEMQRRGWKTQGIDFDESAVKVAKSRGLHVDCGSLEEGCYASDTFDAVTLNHVIEHLPDPVTTLQESIRVLKPGGRLVLFTPNAGSLSHRFFKDDWRGLEPPRHLHLFSMRAMNTMLTNVGYRGISIQPFIVTSIIYESILLRSGRINFTSDGPRKWPAALLTEAFKFFELVLLRWDPTVGDCLIAIAEKPCISSCDTFQKCICTATS